MLRFHPKNKSFERIEESNLKENEIFERHDLQQAIFQSWDAFRNEMGMPNLYLIGQEISSHEDVKDRIDILAFDADELVPVVIELKRSSHKLHLLQALTYAAMVSLWSRDRFMEEARKQNVPEIDDLSDILGGAEIKKETKVILIAETFDPEVIISSHWLYERFDVEILAFALSVFRRDNELYLGCTQKFPLPELSDSYSLRTSPRREKESKKNEITWEEVQETLKYPWGGKAIELCRPIKEGEPARRRFGAVRANFDGFVWISLNLRRSYINVYLKGSPENAETFLKSKFKEPIEIAKWRDGYSFLVKTERQFNDLIAWLKLGSTSRKAA